MALDKLLIIDSCLFLWFTLFFFSFCDENDIPVFIYLYPLGCASACRAGISFWYSFIVCLSALMNMIKQNMIRCARIEGDQAVSID